MSLVIGLVVGIIIGFILCIICQLAAEEKYVRTGIANIYGELYTIRRLHMDRNNTEEDLRDDI